MVAAAPAQGHIGETLAVEITGFAHGGFGIGHLDSGEVVFARGAALGEIVRVRITEQKKTLLFGEVTTVVDAHPQRVEHRCPAAAAGAGCCDLDFLEDAAERDHKSLIVADQLWRIGKIDIPIAVTALRPGAGGEEDHQRGWRTRTRLIVDERGNLGMRARKSQKIVTATCQQLIPGMLKGVAQYDFTPGNEVVIAIDATGQRHVVELGTTAAPAAPQRSRGRRAAATRRRQQAPRWEVVAVHEGSGTATEAIGNYYIDTPATGFWQPHVFALDTYLDTIRGWLKEVNRTAADGHGLHGTDSADLYGGVGAFGTVAAEAAGSGGTVHVIEANPAAIAAGEESLSMLPLQYHRGGVEQVLPTVTFERPVGVVIADPPRKGAGQSVIELITARQPRAVVHVGCDPATFARDARSLIDLGYELRRWEAFNAFPGTHHVEVIGLFLPVESSTQHAE